MQKIFMERETGIEPATSSLGSLRSTTELLPLSFVNIDDGARQVKFFPFYGRATIEFLPIPLGARHYPHRPPSDIPDDSGTR
jgi:hypothetical protein